MTLKDKAKTYNFWISIVSAAVLIARIIGDKFNIFIDTTLIMDITTGLCSIFVILGILSAPKATTQSITYPQENFTQTEAKQAEQESIPAVEFSQELTNENDQLTQESETVNDSLNITNDNTKVNEDSINKEPNELATENPISCLDSTPADNSETNINETSPVDILKNINNPKINSILEVIESLKAEIHKANMTVEEITKLNN